MAFENVNDFVVQDFFFPYGPIFQPLHSQKTYFPRLINLEKSSR